MQLDLGLRFPILIGTLQTSIYLHHLGIGGIVSNPHRYPTNWDSDHARRHRQVEFPILIGTLQTGMAMYR
ncbi:hypothetical protein SAMN05421543_11393 [Alicyclobacillus macrosporangiidus]|uniref:Uncharacterized protein n=1 Tax=Alicyclobacillus macrosporangiidus TaxID=392015 RepID=A0A1I7K4K9_9BACL|nr:hypothetical protein SAMN05421543_11393 [Alicyclobacillus macrosporangiidus]